MHATETPQIFDDARRKAKFERAYSRVSEVPFLWKLLAEDMADRIACTVRSFKSILLLGPLARWPEMVFADSTASIVPMPFAQEDRLNVELGQFDLIIAAGTLDSVNDLPGALIQIRRALQPDGLFLGAMFGAGSLASLKRAMLLADGTQTRAHLHPQIELKVAADLLSRTGFALPVADLVSTEVRYRDWSALVSDLRDAGVGNCLSGPRNFLGQDYCQRLDSAWNDLREDDGKVSERFEFIHLNGWAPAPSQPKAARRGSGEVSLARLLGKSEPL